MHPHRGKIIQLPPNRVWRTYPGGRTLDEIAARIEAARVDPNPLRSPPRERRDIPALTRRATEQSGACPPARPSFQDTHFAEDWIASTTRAVNPPEAALSSPQRSTSSGVSQVRIGDDPTSRDFAQLLASDPEYFFGVAHVKKYGPQPQLLVKFLDSGTRLHFQVHPTREFAQRVLGAPSGKTEAYHVLAVRDEVERVAPNALQAPRSPEPSGLGSSRSTPASEPTGYIYVGFQRPPTPAQLRDFIVTQNIAAIEACFDKITVQPGDTFIIPGGTPHALGAGVFMVEIQEPSDLVVRFEFERGGYVLPESARFMNRDVDFALAVFDFTPLPPAKIEQRVRCRARRVRDFGADSWQDELIGPQQTDCFRVAKTRVSNRIVKDENSAVIAIVTRGTVIAEVNGFAHRLHTYEKIFLPAGLGPVTLTPEPQAELLECLPPV